MSRAHLHYLLQFAVLAPSTHNTQPWRFRIAGDHVEVWADASRGLPRIDPALRQLHMSCGAALFHLRIGLRRYGWTDVVDYLPDPSEPALLARLCAGAPITPALRESELFAAIPARRTHREPFLPRPVAADVFETLAVEAAREGGWLERLHPHDKLEVADVVDEADRHQLADARYRRELARWLVPRGSRRTDGIPMIKKDVATSLPIAAPLLVRSLDRGDVVGAHERELAIAAPLLAVLGTDLDDALAWIAAGEAMEAVLLRATHLGLGASFLNQALEQRDLRRRVARTTGRIGFPQLILRLGFAPTIDATPRRPLDEVVVTG